MLRCAHAVRTTSIAQRYFRIRCPGPAHRLDGYDLHLTPDEYAFLLTDGKVHRVLARQLCSTSSQPGKMLVSSQAISLLMGSSPGLPSREGLRTPNSLMCTNPLKLYERLFGFPQTFDSLMQFLAKRNTRTSRRSSRCWRWRISPMPSSGRPRVVLL